MDAARQNMPKKRRNQRDYCLFQPDCCPFCLPLPYFCCIIKYLKTVKMNLIRKAGFLLVCATMVAAGNGTAQNVQRPSQGIKCATQGGGCQRRVLFTLHCQG